MGPQDHFEAHIVKGQDSVPEPSGTDRQECIGHYMYNLCVPEVQT